MTHRLLRVKRRYSVPPPVLEAPLPVAPVEEAARASYAIFPSYVGTRGAKLERWRFNELIAGKGRDIFLRMQKDDAVRAALIMGTAGVLSRKWRLEVDDDDEKRAEAARVLTYLLTCKLHGNVAGLISAMLTAKSEGFAPVEKVYGATVYEGQPYWYLRAYKLRAPHTFQVVNDLYGNLVTVKQLTDDGITLEIDPRRFIWYVHRPEVDPDFGESDLIAAYPHWWGKRNVLNLWNVYVERAAGGFISIQTNANYDKLRNAVLTPQDKATLDKIVTNWQQTMGLVLPPGYEAILDVPASTDAFEKRVQAADKGIARALLQPNLLGFSEQGDYGSRGQASTQMDAWGVLLDRDADQIADRINEDLITELTIWNFGENVEPPRFAFDPLTEAKRAALVKGWVEAVEKGAVVNTFEDELHTRSLLSYGDREDTPGMDKMLDAPMDRNPLDSARRVVRAKYAAKEPLDLSSAFIEATLYNGIGREWERVAADAARMAFESLEAQLRQRLVAHNATPLAIEPELLAEIRRAVLQFYERVWRKGQQDASRESRFALAEDAVADWLAANADRFVTDLFDDKMIKVLQQVLLQGIADNVDVKTIIEEALRALQPVLGERTASGWDAATPAQIATAVRTVLTTTYNQARKSFWESPASGGYVVAYKFSALLDDHTTLICRSLHGKTWAVDDPRWKLYTPALHYGCRSLLYPITANDDWTPSEDVPDGIEPAPGFGV